MRPTPRLFVLLWAALLLVSMTPSATHATHLAGGTMTWRRVPHPSNEAATHRYDITDGSCAGRLTVSPDRMLNWGTARAGAVLRWGSLVSMRKRRCPPTC